MILRLGLALLFVVRWHKPKCFYTYNQHAIHTYIRFFFLKKQKAMIKCSICYQVQIRNDTEKISIDPCARMRKSLVTLGWPADGLGAISKIVLVSLRFVSLETRFVSFVSFR